MLKPIVILDWYYNDSGSELGFRGQSYTDAPPSSDRDFHPDRRTLRAAAKQKAVRAALLQLSYKLQSALESAYAPRPLATQLKLKYGLIAGIVARGWPPKDPAELEKLVAVSTKLLATAHKAFMILYSHPKDKSAWLCNLER